MYLQANIDRAIVMTQYDLRGFSHPLGFREGHGKSGTRTPKGLYATICNFMCFMAGFGGKEKAPTDESYANCWSSSFEEYLAMCNKVVKECDLSEKEAIQLIIQDMLKQVEGMHAEVASGKREPSAYLLPIEKDNGLGKILVALATAFEVELPASTNIPVSA